MLEKITLKDFQVHKNLELELDPSITTVTGRTDAGKSSIARALRWLCTNRPSGSGFIRHSSSSVRVSLQVDGRTVLRRKTRGPGGNIYRIDDKIFAAFGQDVPSDVQTLLNIGEVNWQRQHDAPFWFSLSPGEVSKQLNAIVNLDLIDRTLAHLASELRKSKLTVAVSEGRLLTARLQRDKLAWVTDANAELKRIEVLYSRLQEVREKTDQITATLVRVREYESAASDAAAAILSWQKGPQIAADKLLEVQERAESIKSVIRSITNQEQELERVRGELDAAKQELAAVKTCPFCGQKISKKI